METKQLKSIKLSSEMMTAAQISSLIYEQDYSSFEVWATSSVIEAGTPFSDARIFGNKYASDAILSDAVVSTNIPAGKELVLEVKATRISSDADVVIDFGDNNVVQLKDLAISKDQKSIDAKTKYTLAPSVENQRYNLQIWHTYADEGRYMVKILGSKYFGIRAQNSIVSRVLDEDCRLASCCREMASYAKGSKKLLAIAGYKEPAMTYNNITNWQTLIRDCPNLVKAVGIRNIFGSSTMSIRGFMQNCYSLKCTDIVLPYNCRHGWLNNDDMIRSCMEVFDGCSSLSANIEDLFPKSGFNTQVLNLTYTFRNCKKINGTVPAKFLWDDPTKIFCTMIKSNPEVYVNYNSLKEKKIATDAFSNCSQDILAQVPVKFNGNMFTDDDNYAASIDTDQTTSRFYNVFTVDNNGKKTSLGLQNTGNINIASIINGRIDIVSHMTTDATGKITNHGISGNSLEWTCIVYPGSIITVNNEVGNIVRQNLETELKKFRTSSKIMKLKLSRANTSEHFKLTAEEIENN